MIAKLVTSSRGAIDLTSILVAVIIVGLISGVVSVSVFAVIPWTHDNAAKTHLGSIAVAQASYKGAYEKYGDYKELVKEELLPVRETTCSVTSNQGRTYTSATQSPTGKVFINTNTVSQPWQAAVGETTCLGTVKENNGLEPLPPATEPTPTVPTVTPKPGTESSFTLRCDKTTSMLLPTASVNASAQWSDGVEQSVTTGSFNQRTLAAGVTYKVTITGTFGVLSMLPLNVDQKNCVRSMDLWGSASATVVADYAFAGANNLTSIPQNIPATVTSVAGMFQSNKTFNQDLSTWDTANIKNMSNMFNDSIYTKSLNSWNVSNATNLSFMFASSSYNQPLDNWKTANVLSMEGMFQNNLVFNQNISSWNTTNLTSTASMFAGAKLFNQPLNTWTVNNVVNMNSMFKNATSFNQPLNNWNTSKVTNVSGMFLNASSFSQNLSGWKLPNILVFLDFALGSKLNILQLPKLPIL